MGFRKLVQGYNIRNFNRKKLNSLKQQNQSNNYRKGDDTLQHIPLFALSVSWYSSDRLSRSHSFTL